MRAAFVKQARVLLFTTLAVLFLTAAQAFAACSSPNGNEGDIVYAGINHAMVFCNGTSWIAMGTNSTISFGTLTTNDFCTATSSSGIQCTTGFTGTGNVVLATSPSLTSPTMISPTVSSGGLTVTAGGLTVSAGGAAITGTVSGTTFSGSGSGLTGIGTSNMTAITGTPSATTFLAGNGTWATLSTSSLPSLAANDIWIGNGSSAATAVALGGDCTLTYAGGINCTKSNGTLFGSLATLSAAPAGTLTGTTLASNVITSSLTGVGVITSGTWNGNGIGIFYGGTNATSQTTNGVNYFNGTSITSGSGFVYTGGQVGIGTATPTAEFTLNGTDAFQFGTNYATSTTPQNDVAINTSASVRYTGTAAVTFNGIVAGANGQIIYLHNGSSNALTLANQAAADTTVANQIVTGTGSNLTVASNSAVILQYDSTATNSSGVTGAWRVIGGSGSAIPAGTTGQVQYNSGSNTLAANSNFTFIAASNQLVVGTGAATPTSSGTSGTVAGFVMNVIPQPVTLNTLGSFAGGISVNPATTGQMAYYSTASAISGTPNLYVSGSNIGIGTATAAQPLTVNGNIDMMGANGYLTEIANGSVATVLNLLAKLDTSGHATAALTSDTDGMIGIVVGNAGTSGKAQVAMDGQAACTFDGTAAAGDFVTISSTNAGYCHDTGGTTRSATAQTIGRVLTANSGSGTAATVALGLNALGASGSTVGIGTANYIPMWSSSTALANSVMYQSGSNVGIGTTAPNTTLHVQGFNNQGIARFTTSDYVLGSSGSGILIQTGAATGNTYTRLDAYSAGFSVFNNLILQTGGGNVGIGTTTPANPLDVWAANTNQLRIRSTGSNRAQIDIDNQAGGNQSALAFAEAGTDKWQIGKQTDNSFFEYDIVNTRNFLGVTTAGNLTLGENSQMSLPAAGNVGIGTTGPNYLLDVETPGTGSVGTVIVNATQPALATGNTAQIFLGKAGVSNQVAILGYTYNSSGIGGSSYLSLGLWGSSNALTINGSGNVGIGVTGAAQTLQVGGTELINTGYGSGSSYSDLDIGGINGWVPGDTHTINFVYGTAASPTVFNSIQSKFDGTNAIFNLVNTYNSTTPVMTLKAGNVGIGTTSPGAALVVWGDTYSNNYYKNSDRRLKENIKPIAGLDIVQKLNGVTYTFKKDGKLAAGVIAQDTEAVMPEAVVTDNHGMKLVSYDLLIAPLIEAVKELKSLFDGDHDQIAQLKAANDNEAVEIRALQTALKAANDNQAARLKTLEDEIASMKSAAVKGKE